MEDNSMFKVIVGVELKSKLVLKEIDSKINLKTEIIETDEEKNRIYKGI